MATIEKEKALDVVKQMVADGQISQDVAEKYFPELKESENEELIKELLNAFKDATDSLYMVLTPSKRKAFIAWLEKQGEHKHQYNSRPRYVGEEELLGEQNHTDKVEPKFKVGDIIKHKERGYTCKITAIDTATAEYGVSECNGTHLPFDFQDAWELVEQKPWSEEDEKIIDNIISILYNEQNNYQSLSEDYYRIEKLINWLKSLKPQFQWKPSEGQMVALNCAITAASDDLVCLNVKDLKSLYEQLKKLKG